VISHFNSKVRAGEKILAFHDYSSLYHVSLGMIIPSESWDALYFLIHSIWMLKYKEAQENTCGFHSTLK